MAVVIANDFDDEATGSLPTTDAGTWTQAGGANATVETLGAGRALRHPATVGDLSISKYIFTPISAGRIYCYFTMRRNDNAAAFFQAMIYGSSLPVARITMMNDGVFSCIVSSVTEDLYTEAGYDTLTALVYAADTDYSCRILIDYDNSVYYAWVDSVPVGYDDSGSWESAIPFENAVSGIATFYGSQSEGSGKIGWIDDLYIISQDAQDTPPSRITLVSPFSLDNATVTSYKGATTPNRASSTLDGSNVLEDSVGQKWYSEDCSVGNHKLLFDFGSGVTKTLRYFAMFNHNMDYSGIDTGSISGIRFIGFNDTVSGWVSPLVQVDLLDQKLLDPMIAWIPTHTACRYYGLEITITIGELTTINNLTIGRVVGAVSPEIWTPDMGCSIDYQWTDIDPSIVAEMEGNNRQARVKNPYREISVSWNHLYKGYQETLRTNYRLSGQHKQWVMMLDPTNEPQGYTVLGYIGGTLGFSRGYQEGAKMGLSITETVE